MPYFVSILQKAKAPIVLTNVIKDGFIIFFSFD